MQVLNIIRQNLPDLHCGWVHAIFTQQEVIHQSQFIDNSKITVPQDKYAENTFNAQFSFFLLMQELLEIYIQPQFRHTGKKAQVTEATPSILQATKYFLNRPRFILENNIPFKFS